MNITEEKIDEQNALLKIKVESQDYYPQYEDLLKSYRKQTTMPGFRPGKVPMGIVKKRYGKSALGEELNKVLNDSIQNYIKEKDLKVLGSPLPIEDQQENGDWDNPTDFNFTYELGLAPAMKVSISDKDKFDFYTIEIDDKMLSEQITNIARRYGKMSDVEKSGKDDMLIGDFVELDADGEVVPGGIMNNATVTIDKVDDETKNQLIGKSVGDDVVVDPHKVADGHDDLAKMLGISHIATHDITTDFKFIIREIKHLAPAEINQELFDKIFGEGEVSSEDEFKEKIKEDLQKNFMQDSDRLFKRDITKQLIAKYNPSLPDEFLKRWIKETNENPLTAEEVERDYDSYRNGLQWQLIFNELIEQKAIQIEQKDAIEKTKTLMAAQFAQYGLPAPEDEELTKTALKVLGNQDEARKVYDMLYDEKLVEYIRAQAKVNEKEVAYKKFVEMASQA